MKVSGWIEYRSWDLRLESDTLPTVLCGSASSKHYLGECIYLQMNDSVMYICDLTFHRNDR